MTNEPETVTQPTDEPSGLRAHMRAVPPDQKRRAYIMLGAAGVTLAVLFLSRLIWLFKPLFDLVYYGTLPIVLYYICLIVVYTVYVVFLARFLRKHCDCKLFAPRKGNIDIVHTLAIIALGAVTVFCISAGFGFKIKIELEMKSGLTMASAFINVAIYFYYGLHLWLGLTAAAIVQRAMTILIPTRYSLPWGAIVLVTAFGLIEFALEVWTTTHILPWLYYILTYVYAAIYELSGRSYHITFWACIIIMVL